MQKANPRDLVKWKITSEAAANATLLSYIFKGFKVPRDGLEMLRINIIYQAWIDIPWTLKRHGRI